MNKTECNNTIMKKYVPIAIICLCSFIMSLTASDNPFSIGRTGIDSSVFHYIARVILKGGMPYRDSFDHKGPLIYLLDALGLAINMRIGVWMIELLFIFLTFLFSYKIAKMLRCNDIKSLLAVMVSMLTLEYYFEGGNFVEEYACALIMIALYIFIKFFINRDVKNIELIICGMTFGAVCLLRINMAALWVVMCIGVLIAFIKSGGGTAGRLLRLILWFTAGVLIITLPVVLWLLFNDSFG